VQRARRTVLIDELTVEMVALDEERLALAWLPRCGRPAQGDDNGLCDYFAPELALRLPNRACASARSAEILSHGARIFATEVPPPSPEIPAMSTSDL